MKIDYSEPMESKELKDYPLYVSIPAFIGFGIFFAFSLFEALI